MSVSRCGWCGAPTMSGAICRRDWERLEGLLDRCRGLEGDLEDALVRRRRTGETVRRSTTVPLPYSVPASEARTALVGALHVAVEVICPRVPPLRVESALSMLRFHREALRLSWVAPVLLAELEPAVAGAVRAVDVPRGRLSVPGRCRECGPSMLYPVGGVLACDRCGERHTVGEVRVAG